MLKTCLYTYALKHVFVWRYVSETELYWSSVSKHTFVYENVEEHRQKYPRLRGPSVTLRRDETIRRVLPPCEGYGSYAPANYRKEQRDDTCDGVASNKYIYIYVYIHICLSGVIENTLFINICCLNKTWVYTHLRLLFEAFFFYKKRVWNSTL